MKSLILAVDDDSVVLDNLKTTLELNNYIVITAQNGQEALDMLGELEGFPDLIISDIMMPIMDGYDFFKVVSNDPRWNTIPFLFLSVKTSPTDIIFGKLLGVDDYLIKPFRGQDLLAIITGKISRRKRTELIKNKVTELLTSLNITPPGIPVEKKKIILIEVSWDDFYGPKLISHYPKKEDFGFSLEDIGTQLYQSVQAIYGNSKITKGEGLLINIENIKNDGYIYFDSYPDLAFRSGEKQFMIGLIAPSINYLESLKIKAILKELSPKIKEKRDWNIQFYWEKIVSVLSIQTIS